MFVSAYCFSICDLKNLPGTGFPFPKAPGQNGFRKQKSLRHDVLFASNFIHFPSIRIHRFSNTPPILHSSIFCTGHEHNMPWSAISFEGLPVAILSGKTCREIFARTLLMLPVDDSIQPTWKTYLKWHKPYCNHLGRMTIRNGYKSLLQYIFFTSNFNNFSCFGVCKFSNTSSVLHSAILCMCHEHNMSWSAISFEGFPVAIFSPITCREMGTRVLTDESYRMLEHDFWWILTV